VPDVETTNAGRPVESAIPNAKNAPLRSSNTDQVRSPGASAQEIASGDEREPGQTTASLAPPRTSSSTSALAHA
jgi:hypothetical protein